MGGGEWRGNIAECDVVLGCILFGSIFHNQKMQFYLILLKDLREPLKTNLNLFLHFSDPA